MTKRYALIILRGYGVVIALLLLIAVVESQSTTFLTSTNLFNLSSQWAPVGIIAAASTYVVLTGGLDLSVGATYTLCAVVAAALGGSEPPVVAFAAALGVGVVVGLVNGLLIAVVNMNPFVATLGVSFMVTGVTLVASANKQYIVSNAGFANLGRGTWHGMPYSGMILLGVLVIGGLVLARTIYGQGIYAVGGNPEASRLAGLRVRRTVASTYVLAGVAAAIGGILTASQLSSASSQLNTTILFDVLTVVIVAGNSLAGGVGSMWRTAVGLGLVATIQNGFNLLNVNPYYQDIVKGAIIVGALALDQYARRVGTRTVQTPGARDRAVSIRNGADQPNVNVSATPRGKTCEVAVDDSPTGGTPR